MCSSDLPYQPGNDIDVYLSPLIDDLRLLWEEGVDVLNAYSSEHFNMRAMLFCTINDFPAYSNLSGYTVKGHKVCPICEDKTCYHQLKRGSKTVYLGHQKFLKRYHPYRKMRKAFNGEPEYAWILDPVCLDFNPTDPNTKSKVQGHRQTRLSDLNKVCYLAPYLFK